MPLTVEQIEQAALSLPDINRHELAMSLLDSLPVPEGLFEEGTPEFQAEIARRCAEVEDGTAELVSYEDVMRGIDELIRRG